MPLAKNYEKEHKSWPFGIKTLKKCQICCSAIFQFVLLAQEETVSLEFLSISACKLFVFFFFLPSVRVFKVPFIFRM